MAGWALTAGSGTRAEAEKRCAELNAEAAAGGRWIPRGVEPDRFDVVEMRVAELGNRPPFKETVEARSKPSIAEDPRDAAWRNVPPFGPAGA